MENNARSDKNLDISVTINSVKLLISYIFRIQSQINSWDASCFRPCDLEYDIWYFVEVFYLFFNLLRLLRLSHGIFRDCSHFCPARTFAEQ